MLETLTKRESVAAAAAAVANSGKKGELDFLKVILDNSRRIYKNGIRDEEKNKGDNSGNGERFEPVERESETDSEKESGRNEDIKSFFPNRICEEKEEATKRRSETSGRNKFAGGEEESSPEESTIKQTWSGSMSPGLFTSGSDFSSSEYDEEEDEIEGRKDIGIEQGDSRGKGNDRDKRNSLTKDCNSDFQWVASEKQSDLSSLRNLDRIAGDRKSTSEKFQKAFQDVGRNSDSVFFYFADRKQNQSQQQQQQQQHQPAIHSDYSMQIRLPPQISGSLDRKRVTKSRSERDQKCKSSAALGRSLQSKKKCHAKSLGEGIDLEEGRKRDFNRMRDDWQHCSGGKEAREFCRRRNSVCSDCCGNYCGCHHHHHHHHHFAPPQIFQCRQSQRKWRNDFGSCENLGENFGSRWDDVREEKNRRKFSWRESQQILNPGSAESLPFVNCCRQSDDRDVSWKLLGKAGPELEERLIRLENDKESLQLHVSVLTEQVVAQSEKISDLQQMLDDKKQQLANTEDLLQREILTRSSLETQKLELMSAISELKLQQAAIERENYELREERKRCQQSPGVKPPSIPRNVSPSAALLQSSPLGSNRISPSDYSAIIRKSSNHPISGQDFVRGDSFASQSDSFSDSHHKYSTDSSVASPSPMGMDHHRHHQRDTNGFSSSPQPNLRRSMDHYSSLPRQKILENRDLHQLSDSAAAAAMMTTTTAAAAAAAATGRTNSSGKGLTSLITLKSEKSYSAPNLAETEKEPTGDEKDGIDIEISAAETSSKQTETIQNRQETANRKGLKKLFNKIKRSNSGNVSDLLKGGEFKREKIRATMGPRIGGQTLRKPPNKPIAEWDTENLCGWLEELNLENYVADLRRWIKSGSQLLGASPSEIEKELGMKNHLHKKKLLLALQEMSENGSGDDLLKPAGRLDTSWVMRWLDDVGLPQHKEAFLTARIDGRMLHRLTMDDLATMHITSALHVASLKKGIKVLRECKMDPNCLTRRSIPDEPPPSATDVALWTNHRVMEWLRIVDLAEYAPNLRGSGVHGALMVYENKFTADLLASLLNIPPNKTLLRRHLNTHFKELLGREVIQAKREAETTLGYIPLTPSAKVKTIKKPQFTLKRKKNKSELEMGDLVCPLEDGGSGENSFSSSNSRVSPNGGGGHGGTKEKRHVPDVCPLTDPSPKGSPLSSRIMRI